MTKYIQITNSREYSWYEGLTGNIYPVEDCPAYPERYCIAGVTNDAFDSYPTIRKSDCEEVALPTIQKQEVAKTLPELEGMARKFAGERFSALYHDSARIGFIAGYQARHEAKEAAQAGAHLITTEKLQALAELIADEYPVSALDWLKMNFPAVFAPAKTYQPSERIIHGDDELMLIRSGDTWNLLDVNTGLTRKVCLITESDTTALSEEQLQYLLAGTREEAMQAFNSYDNAVSEALKGGQP